MLTTEALALSEMPLPFTHAYVPVRSSEEADHNSNVDASPRSRPFLHSLTTAVALLVLTTSAIFLLAVWRLQLSLPSIGEVSSSSLASLTVTLPQPLALST